MAAPTYTRSSGADTAVQTSHAWTLPSGSGGTLILVMTDDGTASAITPPAGFTAFTEVNNGGTVGQRVAYKVGADGSEPLTWTTSGSGCRGSWVCYRVQGATGIPQIITLPETSTTTDPALSLSFPLGDYLAIAVASVDQNPITTVSSYPAGYSDTGNVFGSAVTSSHMTAYATKTLTDDEETLGVFTLSESDQSVTSLIVIPGDLAVAPPEL